MWAHSLCFWNMQRKAQELKQEIEGTCIFLIGELHSSSYITLSKVLNSFWLQCKWLHGLLQSVLKYRFSLLLLRALSSATYHEYVCGFCRNDGIWKEHSWPTPGWSTWVPVFRQVWVLSHLLCLFVISYGLQITIDLHYKMCTPCRLYCYI